MNDRNCYITKIASHRAGALLWGELTPRGFINSLKLSVEQVELDIHTTKDGRLAVIHDYDIGRVTDSKGEINDMTWLELSEVTINYSGGEHPLVLEDVCELYCREEVDLRLEIKTGKNWKSYNGVEELAVNILRKFKMEERTIISSFSLEALNKLSDIKFKGKKLWLISEEMMAFVGMENIYNLGNQNGINAFSVYINQLRECTDFFKKQGAIIGAWGAHCKDTITEALELEADTFTCDRPDLAVKLRQKIQKKLEPIHCQGHGDNK